MFVTTIFVDLADGIRVIYINTRTEREQEVATGNIISAPNTCGLFERLDARNRCRRVCYIEKFKNKMFAHGFSFLLSDGNTLITWEHKSENDVAMCSIKL